MKKTYSTGWKDYELIDAGNGKKLERWGNTITIRPERNAYFKAVWSMEKWKSVAHFHFVEHNNRSGEWVALKQETPEQWSIKYNELSFLLQLTQFKHVGLFPEQKTNWDFIAKHLQHQDKFLNLFAYTGAASLVAKSVGADVYHCDSMKAIITWANNNSTASGLNDIHWVAEDALKFAAREVKREKKYQGIIMDPPAFGLGIKKERWKIEQKFPELIELAAQLLASNGFLIVNTYSPKLNEETILPIVQIAFPQKKISVTKLCIKSTTGKTLEYGELTRITND